VDHGRRSLTALLEQRVTRRGHVPFIVCPQGAEVRTLTFGELHHVALANIRRIRAMADVGDRVLLAINDPIDFVEAFFSVIYAGAIPVPIPAPAPRRASSLQQLAAVAAHSGAKLALVSHELLGDLHMHATQHAALSDIRFLPVFEIRSPFPDDEAAPYLAGPDSVAFLQFTSGSTSAPKGVMVTHGNILHNQALIQRCFRHSEQTVFAGWLPLYHDMGLIGNVLQPLFLGITSVLLSPMAFMERPAHLLRVISDYRATTCGMPNFGYAHCVQRVRNDELTGVDLSSWSIAYNGSEPVRAETMRTFAERFDAYGFHKRAFYPCYGMAEATLFVTGWSQGAPWIEKSLDPVALVKHAVLPSTSDDAISVVSSGYLNDGHDIRIIDPDTHVVCRENQVGEIWVAGPSVAQGYWGAPDKTRETFQAYLATNEGPFLRTGDLGFIENGRLYVTGRLKDLIIVRGKNHYPEDIEATIAGCCAAFVPNGTAAFDLDMQDAERVVIVQEITRKHALRPDEPRWRTLVKDAVARQHQLAVSDVKFVLPKTIPRTSSGKIQRYKCRALYLNAGLALIEQRQAKAKLADTLPIA